MTIDIFGFIGESWFDDSITASSIRKQLAYHKKDDELIVYINSGGGSVIEGLAIYNTLLEYNPIIKIIGEASSIASVIACAGKKVLIAETAVMLFHKPWAMTRGDEDKLGKDVANLKTLKESIKIAYNRKTGLAFDKIEDLLATDIYYNAEKCKEYGFADEVYTPSGDDVQKALSAINNQTKKYFNMNMTNFTTKGGNPTMEYEKMYKDLSAIHDNLQSNHAALLTESKDMKEQIQSLATEKQQLSETVNALTSEREAINNQLSEMKKTALKNQVELDLAKLSDKILPAENNADNNYALLQELIWAKSFDGDSSAIVNGKTPYERKIAEIEARQSLTNLQQGIPIVPQNQHSALSFNGSDWKDKLHSACLAKVKSDSITYSEAYEILIKEIDNNVD